MEALPELGLWSAQRVARSQRGRLPSYRLGKIFLGDTKASSPLAGTAAVEATRAGDFHRRRRGQGHRCVPRPMVRRARGEFEGQVL